MIPFIGPNGLRTIQAVPICVHKPQRAIPIPVNNEYL
jgi:hypothetical protein